MGAERPPSKANQRQFVMGNRAKSPMRDRIEITAFYGESMFADSMEEAMQAALRLSAQMHSECMCFYMNRLVGETSYMGWEPLPEGGYRERYVFSELVPPYRDTLKASFPELFAGE